MTIPGAGLRPEKMPGHWLLARLGKRVLRPGGREMTTRMIESLDIRPTDEVVELAPGLGATARLALQRTPASYTAVERDKDAAAIVQSQLTRREHRCVVGLAEKTGLPDASATVVYGEAMLTLQPVEGKAQIVREAYRLLRDGGRYGIHELCLVPDDLEESTKREIANELSAIMHPGVRPLTIPEWKALLDAQGFSIELQSQSPMHLLEPWRLVQDEGIFGVVRFAFNLLRDRDARSRVLAMRRVFSKYRDHLAAMMMVSRKNERALQ